MRDDAELEKHISRIRQGGAPKYHDKAAAEGKLFVRDRLARLLDPGFEIVEDGLLANAVIPAAELAAEARKLAAKLAGYSALSLRAAKKAIDEGLEKPRVEDALQVELRGFAHLFGSEDQKEGMTAFLEKRVPQFKDR